MQETTRQKLLDTLTAQALGYNTEMKKQFERARDEWIERAVWFRDLGRPLPDKPQPPVKVARATRDIEGYPIFTYGPELVADPTCELPPPPAPLPSGVADVGASHGNGIYQCGPLDTLAKGAITTLGTKRLQKHIEQTPFGVSVWYQEI